MAIKSIFADIEEKKKAIENLSIEQLEQEMKTGDALLLDIREIQERVDLGTIPGSVHHPCARFAWDVRRACKAPCSG